MNDTDTHTNSTTTADTPKIYDHTHLRRFIGILAVSIGSVTVILAQDSLSSISASYWSGDPITLIAARDFFVGGLCVVSAFLLAYRGRGELEPLLSKIGCVAAVLVAFFPTAPDNCETCGTAIHGLAAATLFSILLVFIWGFAKRARKKERYGRMRFYQLCAVLIGLFLAIGAYGVFALDHAARVESGIIFWAEMGALISFGAAWMLAGFYEVIGHYLNARRMKLSGA